MKRSNTICLRIIFTLFIFHCSLFICFAQTASRTDGVNVFYYDSLFDAFSDAAGVSVEQPDEITLLADIVLDEPLIIEDGKHIRLVAGGSDRSIQRSPNLIGYPIFWVRGEGVSLCLGKPGMESELIIDGGYPPIEGQSPLIAVNGLDSKLIMYDKVTLQNNKNSGFIPLTNFYQNGSGVYIRTQENVGERTAEFIMKGGTIRGNINIANTPLPSGGGVLIYANGIFTMEGGVIMNNIVQHNGGGFYMYPQGKFKKTGGIIYGSNAPAGYRNTALTGLGVPAGYGHAVAVAKLIEVLAGYRDDTLDENDNLSYISDGREIGIFGKGDKWDNHDKAFLRLVFFIILPFLTLAISTVLIFRKRYLKKLAKIIQEAADTTPYIDLENMGLSDREKEICELLLSNRTLKEIGQILNLTYSGANFHAQNLYAKLGIEGRTELLVRVKREE
jgi:DNA-binding CsgD family transcriptional regulator